jgi:peptidoglycan-N-acetylglucosamine deacetylase
LALYPLTIPFWIKKAFPNLIWDIPGNDHSVYFTFDDGPHPEITAWVMEQLSAFDAGGTFFCIGENIKKFPSVFKEIIKVHEVGNHTYNHLSGWTTGLKKYLENVSECQGEMKAPPKIFRPPYGRIRSSQAKILRENYKLIMWDLLSGDFDPSINPEANAKRMVELAKPGSILVFHDSEKAWPKLKVMLPSILGGLAQRGFSFKKLCF